MEDLARWLGEQLDSDERIARATDDTLGQRQLTWSVEPVDDAFSKVLAGGRYVVGTGEFTPEDAVHIVAWGPARVLREIAAKREVIRLAERAHDYHETFMNGFASALEGVLRMYAVAYEHRPGFQEAWRP